MQSLPPHELQASRRKQLLELAWHFYMLAVQCQNMGALLEGIAKAGWNSTDEAVEEDAD
jgi:hypothetical protein